MKGLSVILCTYNPDESIFSKILSSIAANSIPPSLDFECIVVDNNSNSPLDNIQYVRRLLAGIRNSRIVSEGQQGLTFSRKRGILEARYDHLLFVDDDNELAPDYIEQLVNLVNRFPFIGAVNAGVINVEFIGEVDPWFPRKAKVHFQDSCLPQTIWGNDTRTFRHWPFGTGLMVKKDVALHYLRQTESGRFSLTDRKGKLLTSGGDGQLVACAVELGYGVGRARELRLNHLISNRKARISYLTRQDYGIYFSNEIFMKECYPERFRALSPWREALLFIKLFSVDLAKLLWRRDLRKFPIAVAVVAGTINGKRTAAGRRVSFFPRLLEQILTS